MSKRKAIIIGAGPAGLTAAYELLEKTDILPIIYEESSFIGGISKTIDYKGNKIDIGGHRFFSKSALVLNWWKKILDMHTRQRVSRILFLGKFFNYPISLNLNTISNLGWERVFKIGLSYLKIRVLPIKREKNLEDFFINRFGKELYETFFKDYTEKVWGVPCSQINASWGAQRIKGLSVSKAIMHVFKKSDETSLIDQFLYPKHGPGELWEKAAGRIMEKGGQIYLNHRVYGLKAENSKIKEVLVENRDSNIKFSNRAEYYFSSMPVKELVNGLENNTPAEIKKIADGLVYRDFITVGVLLDKLKIKIPDNWIYVQENSVKLGRIQVFNNWSPDMLSDKSKIWLGLEYFCNEGDELWDMTDDELKALAASELSKINIIDKKDVIDSTVIRQKKAYPAYFGTYERFEELKGYLNNFENLFLIGRNGMHRYNNMDHSMLSAITAVDNIIKGISSKKNIWDVNAEKDYLEK